MVFKERYIVPVEKYRLPLSQLMDAARKHVRGSQVTAVKVYSDPKEQLRYSVPCLKERVTKTVIKKKNETGLVKNKRNKQYLIAGADKV
jgi:hypothetical protein